MDSDDISLQENINCITFSFSQVIIVIIVNVVRCQVPQSEVSRYSSCLGKQHFQQRPGDPKPPECHSVRLLAMFNKRNVFHVQLRKSLVKINNFPLLLACCQEALNRVSVVGFFFVFFFLITSHWSSVLNSKPENPSCVGTAERPQTLLKVQVLQSSKNMCYHLYHAFI